MATKMKISHLDSAGKVNTESFYTTLTTNISTDTATAIDTWARAYCALSDDTYKDTEIIETVSITEILAE